MNKEPLKGKKIGVINIGEGIDKGILDLQKGTMQIPKEIQLQRPIFDSNDVKSAVEYLKLKTWLFQAHSEKNLRIEKKGQLLTLYDLIDESFPDIKKIIENKRGKTNEIPKPNR